MKKTLLYSLLGCLMLTVAGCDRGISREETDTSFNNPIPIGIINGKTLYRVSVCYRNCSPHYIYFFKDSGDVSINYDVKQGKYTRHEVVIFLNGKAVSTNYLENSK